MKNKNDSEDEDEDEFDDKEIQKLKEKKKGGHITVSAEAYGQYNKKEDFKPKFVPKKQEQKERITKRIMNAFMFSALDEKDRNIVVDAMEEKRFK